MTKEITTIILADHKAHFRKIGLFRWICLIETDNDLVAAGAWSFTNAYNKAYWAWIGK